MAEFPFLDLFHHLRNAGMPLTPDQYDLLRQSLDRGYGLKGWDDLRRLCCLLWVKPCPGYDRELFDRAFDRYVQELRHQWQTELNPPNAAPRPSQRSSNQEPAESALPIVPPRWTLAPPPAPEGEAPVAVRTAPPQCQTSSDPQFRLNFTQMPVSLASLRDSWKAFRQLVREGKAEDLDLEGTIARINREGVFSEVVLRPRFVQRAELLLLIDDSETMVPFRPAIQPLITAVEEHRLSPAQLYRFTVFPDDFLYPWKQPTKAAPLSPLLSRLHQSRSVVWIVSDAGAATSIYSSERLNGIAKFLMRIIPCVRDLIWINPLPSERWQSTTAEEVAQVLDGRMIALDPIALQQAAHTTVSSPVLKLWSLLLNTEN